MRAFSDYGTTNALCAEVALGADILFFGTLGTAGVVAPADPYSTSATRSA